MGCFVNNVSTDRQIVSDIKDLIPDASLRRRMSRVVRSAVATAVECTGGSAGIDELDAVITATGFGCLTDSERFLRNMIDGDEQLLNPTPFIQSTFNTVGGQIALLRRNHCYNTTYVNRSHSFEDALLDALLRLADKESETVLVGAFDEHTPTQDRIMTRMGMLRTMSLGEGAVFVLLSAEKNERSLAEVVRLDFPPLSLSAEEIGKYASGEHTVIMRNEWGRYDLWPTVSAMTFSEAVRRIAGGADEVVLYNEYWGGTPTVIVLRCVGQ